MATPREPVHIMFVRLYLSESPGTGIQHIEHYEAMPIVLSSTAEAQEMFDAIISLVRQKNPTFRERGLDMYPVE